jgi:hypothetical protein
MGGVAGRRQMGLFNNGAGKRGSRESLFPGFSWYDGDSFSGDGCWFMNSNSYGGTVQGSEYIKVDPKNKSYIFSLMCKTHTRSYNNRLGSGHLGFACYDKNKNFVGHYNIANSKGAQLTRAASPGDTVIYINRGDWRNASGGSTGHTISLNFFPATQEDYDYERAPGRYSRVGIYSSAWTSITDMGGGEYRVNLSSGKSVPSGHSYPVGTWVYQTQSGGSYNYALGAPTYPEEWTLKKTGIMTGFGDWSGAGFRWGTEYIKFLNLRNYNYRSERSGNSARYMLDNIQLIEVRNTHQAKLSRIVSNHNDKVTYTKGGLTRYRGSFFMKRRWKR